MALKHGQIDIYIENIKYFDTSHIYKHKNFKQLGKNDLFIENDHIDMNEAFKELEKL